MDEKLNLVRQIFDSDGFRNASQDQQRDIVKQVIATGEIAETDIEQLYNETLSNSSNHALQNLPYDVFVNVILSGDIRGEDLLSLCGSSSKIKEYCNRDLVLPNGDKVSQYLFRQLIEKERPGYAISDQEEPRRIYEKLTTKRLEDFFSLLSFLKGVEDKEWVDADHVIHVPKTIQSLLYYFEFNTWGLLFRTLKLDQNSIPIGNALAIKAFLDDSSYILVGDLNFIISPEPISIANPLQPFNQNNLLQALSQENPLREFKSSQLTYAVQQRQNNAEKSKITNEVYRLWQGDDAFPQILNYLMTTLKIDLATIVARVQKARKLPIFPNDVDIVNLWQNYETYYVYTLNLLLPHDTKSLEKLILDSLLDIVTNYINFCEDGIQELIDDGLAPLQYQDDTNILNQLNQIFFDLQHGVYNRIIRWLIKIHHGVLNKQYSIFAPIATAPQ
jgi:hypothetical protein